MEILITGGTGLIGQAISRQLLEKGHALRYLSRHPGKNALQVPEYRWDVERGELDPAALKGVEAIVNLAGAPINGRWTAEYKSSILRSRVDGTRLLLEKTQELNPPLKVVVSASAVGYYANSLEATAQESSEAGEDFLSLVCQKWEQEAQHFEELGIRTLRLRIGIVLARSGGALPQIAKPIRLGVGAPLASGKQWMPWIHLEDLAAMFVQALENEDMTGAYNAATENVSNRAMTRAIANVLKRPLLLPPVPAWALKLMLGEMAETVLASNRVSTAKIRETGFDYRYPQLEMALRDLLA